MEWNYFILCCERVKIAVFLHAILRIMTNYQNDRLIIFISQLWDGLCLFIYLEMHKTRVYKMGVVQSNHIVNQQQQQLLYSLSTILLIIVRYSNYLTAYNLAVIVDLIILKSIFNTFDITYASFTEYPLSRYLMNLSRYL